MNAEEYLSNPMGKGSSVFMVKDMQRVLNEQYAQLNGKIDMRWYRLGDKYYIAHLKIPSRHAEKLFYDVLLEFDMDSLPKNTQTINKANIRVFSNCPSFTYTYANVFESKGNLIGWCKSRYPSEIFSKDPEKRNPYKIQGYERSLYLAIKYVLTNGRNSVKSADLNNIKVASYQNIITRIKKAKEIEAEYKEKTAKMKERESPEKEKKTSSKSGSPYKNNSKKGSAKFTKPTTKTKKVRSTIKSKKINKI